MLSEGFSNGNSFSNGQSMSTCPREPFLWRLLAAIQDRGCA
jgi:hypothetical protein